MHLKNFLNIPAADVTFDDLRSYLEGGPAESFVLEFKEAAKKDFSKEVAAFAGFGGGRVLYGVCDPTKSPNLTGLQLADGVPSKKVRSFVSSTCANVNPPVEYEDGYIDLPNSDLTVAVVDVYESDWGIHQGSDKKFYMRIGEDSIAAPYDIVASRIRESEARRGANDTPMVSTPRHSNIAPQLERLPNTIQVSIIAKPIKTAVSQREPSVERMRAVVATLEDHSLGLDGHDFWSLDFINTDGISCSWSPSETLGYRARIPAKTKRLDKDRPRLGISGDHDVAIVRVAAVARVTEQFLAIFRETAPPSMGGLRLDLSIELTCQDALLGLRANGSADTFYRNDGRLEGSRTVFLRDVADAQSQTAHDLLRSMGRRLGMFLDEDLVCQSLR